MHASTILAAAALWASASAIPAATAVARGEPELVYEKRAEQTALWVTVDDEGQPQKTYTPSMTVVDGTTSVKNAAPHDLTASVYTFTQWGEITTSSGEPPNPTATGKSGQGAFSRCTNVDGDNAPFCAPYVNSTLYVGSTYYITWDPDYYNKTGDNTTYEVAVRLNWLNHTSGELQKYDDYDRVPAEWGFWPLTISSSMMKSKPYNLSITLLSSEKGSAQKTNSTALPFNIANKPFPKKSEPNFNKETLEIALPTVLGAIAILVIGVFLWNRKTRRIDIGNIMSRSRRHGYTGRKTRRRKDHGGIQLDDAHDMMPPAGEYRDVPERPRRDSDALGSLAGSPIDPNFREQDTTAGGRNAFREEMRRQELERQ